MTRINLIFARGGNGVIGKDNALPWHLPEDMAHFKKQTAGAPVIMGRKTWDSLPPRFRPLPGRTNIVLTRQENWHAEGATKAASVSDAIGKCEALNAPEAWVIGGEQIFWESMSRATRAIVTEIHESFDGDAFAPQFDERWRETTRESHVSVNGLSFSFVTLEREHNHAV
jgi:dihydrofolate reductase